MKEIIEKKKNKQELTEEELKKAFISYQEGKVPDYQMSALLMAICLNGMTEKETKILTDIIIKSGQQLNFNEIPGIKVDKHSTGGVGDKTTLIIVPIVASLDIPIIKMSGRSLGYTGGTIDKLESIPFYQVKRNKDQIKEQVKKIKGIMISQTANLCPLDQKLYALRDVTGTTASLPLIASSIMSKKIASGADKILIDIKVGKGALIKNEEEAQKLSQLMINIGKSYQKEVRTIISSMDAPLGKAIGNALEVKEALEVLEGKTQGPLRDLCVEIASIMVSMGKQIPKEEAKKQVEETLVSKKARDKFLEIIAYQQGQLDKLPISTNTQEIKAKKAGIITKIDALEVAKLAFKLGAGRQVKEEKIDPSVGVVLEKEIGNRVEVGETLMTLYKKKEDNQQYSVEKIFEIN